MKYIFTILGDMNESLKIKSIIQEITKVKIIEQKISLNNKKTCYIQEKMATSWKFFKDQTKLFGILSDSVFE